VLETPSAKLIRPATEADLQTIRRIYNEGIDDRIATLDEAPKTIEEIAEWWAAHGDPFAIMVAEGASGEVIGWASLNAYSHRCAYRGVADLSIYVTRDARGRGVGFELLRNLEKQAKKSAFHKIVLFALASNDHGHRLYQKCGYREVGVFREQGVLEGRPVDVLAMEKLLKPFVLFICRHNTGRSQMAEAFLREAMGDAIEVASAGTIAADAPDPGVVAAMAEIDIDITSARPKLITSVMMARADRTITMGCDVDVSHIDDDWGLPDPKGQPLERVREIREMIRLRTKQLADALRNHVFD